MNPFWKSPTYGVIKAMRATGNRPGVIAQWIELARIWAHENKGPEAEAIKEWLPYFKSQPFYNTYELALMWPALIAALGLSNRPGTFSPGRLAAMLDFGDLPVLKRDDGSIWFENPMDRSQITKYYIVEQIHYWSKRKLSQEQFEREFS